jgi:cysteine-rich repeat protein
MFLLRKLFKYGFIILLMKKGVRNGIFIVSLVFVFLLVSISLVSAIPVGFTASDEVVNAFENGDFSDTTDAGDDNKGWSYDGSKGLINGIGVIGTGASFQQSIALPSNGDYAICAEFRKPTGQECGANAVTGCGGWNIKFGSAVETGVDITGSGTWVEKCFIRNGLSTATSTTAGVGSDLSARTNTVGIRNVKLYRKAGGTVSSGSVVNADFSDESDAATGPGWIYNSNHGKLENGVAKIRGQSNIQQTVNVQTSGNYWLCADFKMETACRTGDNGCRGWEMSIGALSGDGDGQIPTGVSIQKCVTGTLTAGDNLILIKTKSDATWMEVDNIILSTTRPPTRPSAPPTCSVLNNEPLVKNLNSDSFDVKFSTTGNPSHYRVVVGNYDPQRTGTSKELELCRLAPSETTGVTRESEGNIDQSASEQTYTCSWFGGQSAYRSSDSLLPIDYSILVLVTNDLSDNDAWVQCTGMKPITLVDSSCGNNIIDEGELCDDGNQVNGDRCSDRCLDENNLFNLLSDPGFSGTPDDAWRFLGGDTSRSGIDSAGSFGVLFGSNIGQSGSTSQASQNIDLSSIGEGRYTLCANVKDYRLAPSGPNTHVEISFGDSTPVSITNLGDSFKRGCVTTDITNDYLTGNNALGSPRNSMVPIVLSADATNHVEVDRVDLFIEAKESSACKIISPTSSSPRVLGPEFLGEGAIDITFEHNLNVGDKYGIIVNNYDVNRGNPDPSVIETVDNIELCRVLDASITSEGTQTFSCRWARGESALNPLDSIVSGAYFALVYKVLDDGNVEQCDSESVLEILPRGSPPPIVGGGVQCDLPGGLKLPATDRARDSSDNKLKYCGLDGVLAEQLDTGEDCQNDFECKTNLCTDGTCNSLLETTSLITRIWCALLNPGDFFTRPSTYDADNSWWACVQPAP